MIVILDFGSQYTQLIARRVREARVYCEIHPFDTPVERLARLEPAGVILSGGPASVYASSAPRVAPELFRLPVPFLGICYGMGIINQAMGGGVAQAAEREYGLADLTIDDDYRPLRRPRGRRRPERMDEPRRPDDVASRGLVGDRAYRQFPHRRLCRRPAAFLRPPVPSRGGPHPKRADHAGELPVPRLPVRGRLGHGAFRHRRGGDRSAGRWATAACCAA